MVMVVLPNSWWYYQTHHNDPDQMLPAYYGVHQDVETCPSVGVIPWLFSTSVLGCWVDRFGMLEVYSPNALTLLQQLVRVALLNV
jgi:hypothetical protein